MADQIIDEEDPGLDPATGLSQPSPEQASATANEAMGTLAPPSPVVPLPVAPTVQAPAVTPPPLITVPRPGMATAPLAPGAFADVQKAQAEGAASHESLADASAAKKPALVAEQQANAAESDAMAAERDRQATELDRRQKIQTAAETRLRADVRQAEEEANSFKFHDKFADATTARKLVVGLGMIVSGIGAGLTGQKNLAVETLENTLKQDFQKQAAKLNTLEKRREWRQRGFEDSQSAYAASIANLKIQHGLALQAVADRMASMKARKAGIPLAEAQNDEDVAKLRAAGMDTRTKGVEEMAKLRLDQEKAQAELAMSNAHLSIEASNAAGARADRASSLQERQREFDERSSQKKAAAADKEDMTAVRDAKGKIIGHVPTGKGGAQAFASRDADYARAAEQLEALLKDVEGPSGTRVLNVARAKRRDTLYKNALGGVVTVSPMGKTNEAMEIEKGAIGGSGVGLGAVVGANPDAIRRKIQELKDQRQRYRNETLIPLKAENGSEGAAGTPIPKSAPSVAKSLTMPDGSVMNFDADGNPVK